MSGRERNPWAPTIPRHLCAKCGYRWTPRVPNPALCPGCHADWRRPKVWDPKAPARWRCARCGHRWPGRSAAAPKVCPGCGAREWWRPAGRKGKKIAKKVPPPRPATG